MSFANPAINPPRLPSPTKRSLHSRSPSRSPVRHRVKDDDPLLRDLSPTATLRAFAARHKDGPIDHLSRSVATASHTERVLGVRAAQACADMRAWSRELETWEWPGTFDTPEPARKKQRLSSLTLASLTSARGDYIDYVPQEEEEEYWGSLPAQTVRAYGRRLEEIHEDLDEIDVEQLKDFVLLAHRRAGTRDTNVDDSIGTIGAATDLGRLDDFTALITATILQALPFLSKLLRQLNTWNVRLSVLRAAPHYLRDLRQAHTDLDHGWAAIAVSPNPASANFSRNMMQQMKHMISGQVHSLGRRLDHFLDQLEGRPEVVPDSWIEDFEQLEGQYGEWVVQAERKVNEGEWRELHNQAADRTLQIPGVEGASVRRSLSKTSISSENPLSDRDAVVQPSSSRVNQNDDGTTQTTTIIGPTTTTTTTAVLTSGPSRTRHVPISIESYQTAQSPNTTFQNDDDQNEHLSLDSPTSTGPPVTRSAAKADSGSVSTQTVKQNVFTTGAIEKKNILNKSKSPAVVRPFEHASNAFTRLFQRGSRSPGSPAHGLARSSSKGGESVSSGGGRSSRKSDGSISHSSSSGTARREPKGISSRAQYGDLPLAFPNAKPPNARRDHRGSSGRKQHAHLPQASRGTASAVPEARPQHSRKDFPKDARKQVYVDLVEPPSRRSEEIQRPHAEIVKKQRPVTYQPRVLDVPFHSPHNSINDEDAMPADWPLSSSVTPQTVDSPAYEPSEGQAMAGALKEALKTNEVKNGNEMQYSNTAWQSDDFEDTFVQSLPTSPAGESNNQFGMRSHAESRLSVDVAAHRMQELARHSSDREMPSGDEPNRDPEAIVSTELRPSSRAMPAVQEEGGSGQPSPEAVNVIDDEPITPLTFKASHPPFASDALKSPTDLLRRSTSSPHKTQTALRLSIPRTGSAPDGYAAKASPIRRASVKSIESFPRSELKSVDIPPRGSIEGLGQASRSAPHTPLTPRGSEPNSAVEPSAAAVAASPLSPLNYKGKVFPSPPAVPARTSSLSPSPDASPISKRSNAHRLSAGSIDALLLEDGESSQAGPSSKARSPASTPLRAGEDNFDRHVSEVLDRVHAPIKFRARPGAESPLSARAPSTEAKPYGTLRPRPERTPTKGLVLAPAEPSSLRQQRRNTSEPEVKLYHLMQAGRSEPIKLFVRLVGEGERVMVRVGGGWADLADYLRQYAEHHGSRTVSDGGFEVHTAVSAQARRNVSTPAALEPKSLRTFSPQQLERPATRESNGGKEWVDQPGDSDAESNAIGSTPPPPRGFSRPGTSGSNSRPQSPQSPTSSLSMAGPGTGSANSKVRAELPEQRARWVEGMIERVNKSANNSAEKEKKNEDRLGRFGELGKVGGTRRVVFRKSDG